MIRTQCKCKKKAIIKLIDNHFKLNKIYANNNLNNKNQIKFSNNYKIIH